MKEKLSVGDIVKHKAGNQKMVVIKVPDDYYHSSIHCRFFNKLSGKYETIEFRYFELAGMTE